ncbi:Orotate phosphoribosyltransferase [Paraliobacillus sp. PM-2]|uniref:orotate phosphoribosyltransferase n=1 Tax=Paraliobacillus sp. PM-2 TaxID=1462524 RepID=UPI00061BC115|nr:orotate phosphoribosyltransferase [Paraliobacillus sp. PM-2]CQR47759.1 Orotate phosphoribosyltransferase [Paraliobacillus sp. PM-2]
MSISKQLANDLYQMKAVQIKPDRSFTWTSGIKSPIYCDNRLTLSYPEIRNRIADAFVAEIKQLEEQPDCIAGCATAGIPHAAWLADKLNLPMVYVRSKPKGHGKGNQIEGKVTKGQKVVVIEDLISTGGSAIETAEVLRKEGVEVLAVIAIFTYGLPQATRSFEEHNLKLRTLTNFDILNTLLLDKETITKEEYQSLIDWRDSFNKDE